MAAYEPIHGPFVRYCSSLAHGITETEDLVQEALLAALQRWNDIRDKDKLMGYLIGIVNNLARNRRRRLKFSAEWEEAALEKLVHQAPSADVALDIHYLLKAMLHLPEKQGEALRLFEISGFSIREISQLQKSSETATKTRISRARKALREMLQEGTGRLSVSDRLSIYASILL